MCLLVINFGTKYIVNIICMGISMTKQIFWVTFTVAGNHDESGFLGELRLAKYYGDPKKLVSRISDFKIAGDSVIGQ